MAVVVHPALGAPTQPVVSVCIANFNGETMLPACIESVLAQDCSATIEVIVHDDASDDASLVLLRQRYPQILVLESARNVGFCVANNRMVDTARGTYVLLLNNDAALHPEAIAMLLAAAERQLSPGILTLPQYDWETGDLVDRGCLLDPFYNPVPNLDPARGEVAYVIGACFWIPRALWKELGGFPAWMGSIGEDLYLCCRARLLGKPVQVLPGGGYRHRQGATFGGNRITARKLSTTVFRRRMSERNKTATMLICTPTAWVWPLLAIHLVMLAAEGLVLSLADRGPRPMRDIYWPAIRCVFDDWRDHSRLRREVQSRRCASLIDYARPFKPVLRKLILFRRHGMPGVAS